MGFFFFKEKIINLKALGRALDIVTGSEETLCSKGLDHHMGGCRAGPSPHPPLASMVSPGSLLFPCNQNLPIQPLGREDKVAH